MTNIPAFATLFSNFSAGLGWILGSLGSAINFYWMAYKTLNMKPLSEKANTLKIGKSTGLRLAFLVLWCLFVMIVIKPELITFCLGLLATQIAILLHYIYYAIKNGKLKKYFDKGKGEV